MAHLRIANLKKSYKISKTEQQDVLNGINIEFNRGEFVAILGESGCGKSTLLNIIAGLDYQYLGSLVLKGEFMKDFDEHQMDDYRKREVGIIFQSFNLISHMTVFENVKIALSISNMNDEDAKKRTDELIEQVGMTEHSFKYPHMLSGGQKQRVAIARALANDPTIILADEPTGNLDKQSTEEILEILKNIAVGGKIVICVTHSPNVAKECTRIVRIDDGLIVSDEASNAYKTAKSLQDKPSHKPAPIQTKAIAGLSMRNVLQNVKRNLMVVLALGIGISSFVLMLSLSSGIKNFVNVEVGNSINKFQIDVTQDDTATGEFVGSSAVNNISSIDGVKKVVKSSTAYLSASFSNSTRSFTFLSISSTYEGFATSLSYGEVGMADNEVIVSAVTVRRLGYLNLEQAIGNSISITIDNTVSYTICGITDSTSSYDTAYMSLNAMGKLYSSGTAPINMLYVIASDITYISAIVTDIEYLGYVANRQDSTLETLLEYIDAGTLLLAGISAVSLVVASIMIFIVMYTAVIERTKEIGILRAIGARRGDITKLFLFEATVIGFFAGLCGSLFSLLIALVVNLTMASSFATAVVSYNPLFLLLGTVISTIVSIISSISPAGIAANADPIDCLRAE